MGRETPTHSEINAAVNSLDGVLHQGAMVRNWFSKVYATRPSSIIDWNLKDLSLLREYAFKKTPPHFRLLLDDCATLCGYNGSPTSNVSSKRPSISREPYFVKSWLSRSSEAQLEYQYGVGETPRRR